jgi:hypothetical protein
MQPVWLNIVRSDQVNENADINIAELDHLGENEALHVTGKIREEQKRGLNDVW